ncbi:antibiotic biosynthesis monooxygenase [Labilibacter marinus]|uniref:antibiotic biosynthesis monooxygenase n=1 Tax=Labilibacter marinus TaxID=1477105 RepID=UPI00094F89E5|nr:antibiotic biosynthesis monooxygenase [Labilibacter marinus]
MKNVLLAMLSLLLLASCSKENKMLTQLVKFNIKPEFREEFEKASINSLTQSLKEPGNIEMKLFADDNDPSVMYVYSRWKNKEAHTAHGEYSYSHNLKKLAQKSLQSPPQIMLLNETKPAVNHPIKQVNPEDKEETLFFIFKVKDGYREQVLKQFEKHITNTHNEVGNILFDLYTLEGDENTFVVYENWRSKSALWDVHMKQAYSQETGALLKQAVEGDLSKYMSFVTEVHDNSKTIYAIKKQWEVSGFSMPESVFASSNHPWLYVSNVNMKGKGGYISKLSKDGKIVEEKWIDGLAGPTGSDMYNDNLYVADQKYLRIIDVKKGELVQSIKSESAISLNDVSISKSGQIFISDVPGGKIYTLKDDQLVVWLKTPKIHHPNGILVDGDQLMVVVFGSEMNPQSPTDVPGSVYQVNISDKSVKAISTGDKLGFLDGLVSHNKGFFVSAPFAKEVYYVNDNDRVLVETLPYGPADINTDDDNLYLPYIFGDKVAAYKIVKETWKRVTTKEEYLELCADNYYGDAGGSSVASKDGKISGSFGGKELKGTWEWKGEFFSRTSTLGDMDLGYDELLIEVTDTKMRLTLDKGNGISIVYNSRETAANNDLQD